MGSKWNFHSSNLPDWDSTSLGEKTMGMRLGHRSPMLSPCGAHGPKKMVQKESHLTMTATFSTNYYIIGFIFTTILFGQLTHNLETSWRFQPRWKIWSSNWIISPSRDENWKKCLSCHHLPPSFEMYPIPKPPKHPQGVAVELPNKDPPASIMAAFSCTSSHGSLVFQQNAAV